MTNQQSAHPEGFPMRERYIYTAALVTILLIASGLPYTRYVSTMVAYGGVVIVYGTIGLVGIVVLNETDVPAAIWAIATVGLIWGIYVAHLFLSVLSGSITEDAFLRIPAFVLLTGINLFYMPILVPRRVFFAVLSRLSAAVILFGIPTLFVDSYSLGIIEITRWRSTAPIPLTSASRNVVTSFFINPNTTTFLAMAGFVSSVGEYLDKRSNVVRWLIGLNGIGLVLANGRASIVGAVVGVGLLLTHHQFGKDVLSKVFLLGSGITVVCTLALLSPIRSLDVVSAIDLTGRRQLWRGGVQAVLNRPLFGYGAGDTGEIMAPYVTGPLSGYSPHNSYLRLFVETGIVGGSAFVYFVWRTLAGTLNSRLKSINVTTFSLGIAIAITMFFQGFSLFGISLLSVVAAITFGYGLRQRGIESKYTADVE